MSKAKLRRRYDRNLGEQNTFYGCGGGRLTIEQWTVDKTRLVLNGEEVFLDDEALSKLMEWIEVNNPDFAEEW